jgi:hypothetical protein
MTITSPLATAFAGGVAGAAATGFAGAGVAARVAGPPVSKLASARAVAVAPGARPARDGPRAGLREDLSSTKQP